MVAVSRARKAFSLEPTRFFTFYLRLGGGSVHCLRTGASQACACIPRHPLRRLEYDILIEKKLNRTLTDAEACRLQDVRNVIAEINRLTMTNDIRTERLHETEMELTAIRDEIDALPDA